MSYLKSLNFHGQDSDTDSDYLWLSRNVDFIYSCVLAKQRISTAGIRKVNILLGAESRRWPGSPSQGIADILVRSNAAELVSNSDQFQCDLVRSAAEGLDQLCLAGFLTNEEALRVNEGVKSTGLEYTYRLKGGLRSAAYASVFSMDLVTKFSSLSLVLVDKKKRGLRLLDFWPSPWLALMKFVGASFNERGILSVDFRYLPGDDEVRRFGKPLMSVAASAFPVSVARVEDNYRGASRALTRFEFDLRPFFSR